MTLGGDYGRYVSALFVPSLGAATVATGFGGNIPAALGGVDPAGSYADNLYTQDAESMSIFTHNVFEITDGLNLTVGLRYVEETKDGAFDQLSASSPTCVNIANGLLAGAYPGTLAALAQSALGATCFPFRDRSRHAGVRLPSAAADLLRQVRRRGTGLHGQDRGTAHG